VVAPLIGVNLIYKKRVLCMLAAVDSMAVLGVDAYVVRVEVDVSSNFQSFAIVGLPDASVRESGERVRAAVKNSQFTWPMRRITVNLAPADTKKQGPIFDFAHRSRRAAG
jgi:magnesium chelatase family protein